MYSFVRTDEDIGHRPLARFFLQVVLECPTIPPFVEPAQWRSIYGVVRKGEMILDILEDGNLNVRILCFKKFLGLLAIRTPALREDHSGVLCYGVLQRHSQVSRHVTRIGLMLASTISWGEDIALRLLIDTDGSLR